MVENENWDGIYVEDLVIGDTANKLYEFNEYTGFHIYYRRGKIAQRNTDPVYGTVYLEGL